MATDPRSWIYGFLDKVPSIISAPARWIADRIFGIFDDGVEFARWLKSGFDHLAAKGIAFLTVFYSLSAEIVVTVRWYIQIRVPQLFVNAISTVKQWATAAITLAINGAKALISTLDKWAKNAVASVTNALNSLRNWITAQINTVIDKIRKTIDVWYPRLTDPVKMAEWLVGALIGPFWRYAYNNRDKIARWFLNKSPAFTEWLARELEAILRRIL